MPLPAPFQYFGGKTHLRDFILPHIEHTGHVYVEPFCGSANIFFAKAKHPVEVLNDLNHDIVNLFRVLQNRRLFRHFAHKVRWTPYSYEEFGKSLDLLKSSVGKEEDYNIERAWAWFVQGTMGFAGAAVSIGNWRRAFISSNGMGHVASDWQKRLSLIESFRDRLAGVQIDCRPALEVITYWDSPETIFYLDPPYAAETRVSPDAYRHEMSGFDHVQLASHLLTLKGTVVLSGYVTPYYEVLEQNGWARFDKTILSPVTGFTEGERQERVESLWVNRPSSDQSLWFSAPRAARPATKPVITVPEPPAIQPESSQETPPPPVIEYPKPEVPIYTEQPPLF